ncbi:MAG: superoxide dismutase family protein [Novosphingobium sp.]
MTIKIALVALSCTALLAGCSTMTPEAALVKTLAQATLTNGSGVAVGKATIESVGASVYLVASVSGQTPGVHGIHLHSAGKCEGPGFSTAGGHLNPNAHQHGTLNPSGPHLGDLPNIEISADGAGTMKAPLTMISEQLLGAVFDADGAAVVLHAGPDDYKTDPSGNSGGRIACGVLSATSQ